MKLPQQGRAGATAEIEFWEFWSQKYDTWCQQF